MRALERKGCSSFVIELRRRHRPTGGGMATAAVHSALALELASMNILVAGIAFVGCFEWNAVRLLRRVAHHVTCQAGDCGVPAGQRKVRQRMIERLQLLPGNQAVAGLAEALCGARLGNQPRREFSLVQVLVARFTCHAGKVVRRDRADLVAFFVAVLTGHGGVRSAEIEARRLMILQGKSRRLKATHRVATFTPVHPGWCGKLARMDVAMTVEACLRGRMIVDIDQHLFFIETGPHVALGARNALVFARQGVGGVLVTSLDERRRLPVVDRVAEAAFAVIGPVLELAPMRVFMAAQTFFVGHRG